MRSTRSHGIAIGGLLLAAGVFLAPPAAWPQVVYATTVQYAYKEYEPARRSAASGEWIRAEQQFGRTLRKLGAKREGSEEREGEVLHRYFAHLGRGNALVQMSTVAQEIPEHLRAFGLGTREALRSAGASELVRSLIETPNYATVVILYDACLQGVGLIDNAVAMVQGGEVTVSDWAWRDGDVLADGGTTRPIELPGAIDLDGLRIAVRHLPNERKVVLNLPARIPTKPKDLTRFQGDLRCVGKDFNRDSLLKRLAAMDQGLKIVKWTIGRDAVAGVVSVKAALPEPPAGGWTVYEDHGFGKEKIATGKSALGEARLDVSTLGIADGAKLTFSLEGKDASGGVIPYTNPVQPAEVSHKALGLDPLRVDWGPQKVEAGSGEQRFGLELRSNQKLQVTFNGRLSQSKQLVQIVPDPRNPYPLESATHRWSYRATYVTASSDGRQVEVVPQIRVGDRQVATEAVLIKPKGQVVAWFAGTTNQVFTPGEQTLVFQGFQPLQAGDVEVVLSRPGYGKVPLGMGRAAVNGNLEFPFNVGPQDLEGAGFVLYRSSGLPEERSVPVEIRTRGARLEQIEPRELPYNLQSLIRLRFAADVKTAPSVRLVGPTGSAVDGVIAGLDPAEPQIVKVRVPGILAGAYRLELQPGGRDRDDLPLELGLIANNGRHSVDLNVKPNERRRLRIQTPSNREQPLGETLLLLELEEPDPNENPTPEQMQISLSPEPTNTGKVVVKPGAGKGQFLITCPIEREMKGEVLVSVAYKAAVGAALTATASFGVDSRRPAVTSITWNGRAETQVRLPGGLEASTSNVNVQFEASRPLRNVVAAVTYQEGTLPPAQISARRLDGEVGRTWTCALPVPKKAGTFQVRLRLIDEVGNLNEFGAEVGVQLEKLNFTLREPASNVRWTPGRRAIRVQAGGKPTVQVLIRTAGKERPPSDVALQPDGEGLWLGHVDIVSDPSDGQADILVEGQVAATVDLDVAPARARLSFDPRVITRGGEVRVSVQSNKPLQSVTVNLGSTPVTFDRPRVLEGGELLYTRSLRCTEEGPEVRIDGQAIDAEGNRVELARANLLVKEARWKLELRSTEGRAVARSAERVLLGTGTAQLVATPEDAAAGSADEVRAEIAWPSGGRPELVSLALGKGGWSAVLPLEPRHGAGTATLSLLVKGLPVGSLSFDVDTQSPRFKVVTARIKKGDAAARITVEEDTADPLDGSVRVVLQDLKEIELGRATLARTSGGLWEGELKGLQSLAAGDYSLRVSAADRAGNRASVPSILSVVAPAEPQKFAWVQPQPGRRLTTLPGEFTVSLTGADSTRMTVRLLARRRDDPNQPIELGRSGPALEARSPRPAELGVSGQRVISVRAEVRSLFKPGDYNLFAEVFDSSGAPPASGVRGVEQPLELAFAGLSRRWAVLVAMQGYSDRSLGTLRAAYTDARNLALTLIERQYVPEQICIITDAPPGQDWPAGVKVLRGRTRAELDSEFEQAVVAARTGGADQLLLFYAGHGLASETEVFLVPPDAVYYRDDVQRTTRNCLSLASVLAFTEGGGSTGIQKVLLVIDACRVPANGTLVPINAAPRPAFGGQTVVALFASESGRPSYEHDGKGLFTTALVRSLAKAQRVDNSLVDTVNKELSDIVKAADASKEQIVDLVSIRGEGVKRPFLASFFAPESPPTAFRGFLPIRERLAGAFSGGASSRPLRPARSVGGL